MTILKDFLKGILIGIANIIPGVSGGTMAVSVGIYDKLISSITGLFKRFKKSILTLLPIVIGMLVGIVGLSYVITFALENYPLQTSTLFIGLIIGGLPVLLTHVKGAKIRVPNVLLFIVFFAIVILMSVMNGQESSVTDIAVNVFTMLELFVAGIIASAAMIIPGISGSLIMMILGFYNILISNISTLVSAVLTGDMAGILHGVGIFLPFGLGVIVGIFAVAKLIEWLLQNYPILTYSAILGLVIGSPIAILYESGITTFTIGGVLMSIITFIIGFAITYLLGKEPQETA